MNNGQTPGRQLDRYNTRRSSIGESHKPYEHMLLKELPGVKRTNAAMHAVLESALEDNIEDGMHEAQKVRNHALIHYLASLANSNNNDDIFDFDFVQSLIENGADVNSTDRNGQTIFHEVARSWNLDVALFLLEHGANLNQQDKFGRSPLHVAAAVDYADMVRFLVKHGANINIATYGEQQFPIHYAAKNDACKSLKMLLGYGANIDSRDSKNRTPLQVAAEMNRAKSAKLLVQHGAPAGVHDNVGNSALSLLIEKLPDVAIEALDQFHSVSTINRKEFFFLNYLEGNRLQNPKSPAYSALEIAVQSQEFDIILHPVMKRLIDVKWQQFGRKGAVFNLCLNLLYAILWTILAVTSPTEGDKLYLPWSRKAWRLVISVIVCLMTIDEIRKQITGTLRTRNHQRKWISWRASELEEDLQYCHPRWPQEEIYLRSEIKSIRDTPLISSGDSWIYFDWFSLILILGTIASHVVFFNINSVTSQIVHARIIIMLLMVLWIRIMQYARPFEGAGPFVAIFAHIINDIINWGILTLLITVPYACAFWITFGDASRNPVKSYSDVSSLIYGLFSMIVVNDHDFEALQAADATMARLLCGSYIGLMAIINLNILIALLSDTFTRVYGNAVANAIMQRAKTILFLEKSLTKKSKREYGEFIKNFGSPETIDLQRDISANNDRDEQKAADMLKESVQEIHNLIHERFGKRYGEGKKSDLDHIRESLEKIHQGTITRTEKCGCNGIKRKVDRIQEVLVRISYTLKVDISGFGINQQSSSDDDDDDDTLVGQIDEEVESNQNSNWKERTEGWKYETGSQATACNVEGRNPEQQFWSASKAAFNEAYQFEDAESTLSRNARGPSGVASAGRRSYHQSDYRERGGRNQNKSDYRKRRSSDFDQTNRRKFGSIDVDQMSEDEEFISDDTRNTGVMPYKQARDGAESYIPKADRRPFRTEVYQKRLTSEGEEKVSNRVKSNSLREIPKDFMDKQRVLSRQRLSEKRSPRKEVRRAESMPQRLLKNNQLPRRAKESYYTEVGARRYPQKNITESFRREIEEKRRKRRSSPERLSRAHFQNRRDSGSLKRRSTRQRSPNTTLKRKPNERIGEAPEEYYDERQQDVPYKRQSATDSDVTESDIPQDISFEDSQNIAYSDNDVIQTRASRLRERRLLEDWDNRSVKSVAF